MAYCNQDDIIGEVRGLEVSSETVVNEDHISAWISQADNYINGRLSAYYTVPVTGPMSLSILKTISTYKVAHRVKNKLELTSSNSDMKQDVQANHDKQAEKMLNDLLPKMVNGLLIEPVLTLPDADLKARSPQNAALSAYKSANPTFTKGGDNW